jgi:phosphatidylserine decarboxylase
MRFLLSFVPPLNREGWPFVAGFAVASVLLALLWEPLGWLGLLLTAWCAWFFRDPVRVVPDRPGLILSPADGRVQMVVPAVPPPELGLGDAPRMRVSVFLSVFDVHVTRSPAAGAVERVAYRPGLFVNAALDKASEENERLSALLRLPDGRDLPVVQIAGLVARRILCWVSEGDAVEAGRRIGLMRFGSRCDVYLPAGVAPLVAVGQRAVAGETVLADLASAEPARAGTAR